MVILDPKKGARFGIVNSLDDMYREIGCDTIDITRRMIGGKEFDIIVDDNGWLIEKPELSAIYVHGDSGVEPALVGTLIICSHDEEGNTVDVSIEDHMLICCNVRNITIQNRTTGEVEENYVIQLDDWR